VALSFTKLKFSRVRAPVGQVLAVDAGSRRIKMLLASNDFGQLGIVKEEAIDLAEEGLVSAGEINAHLQSVLDQWGRPPLALVLPQHLSISQVVDLPLAPESEVEKLIEEETIKLSGVSGSRIVYDFVRTEALAANRQQFWVTLCQEGDIRERIQRLGVENEDLCEITTTANALIAAFRAASPLTSRAVLVHAGAQTTVVVILLAGQGAFATSFQMGGDFFTRALAREWGCSEEKAESLKREGDRLNGAKTDPELIAVVDGWIAELKRQLNDWFEHHPGGVSDASSFEMIASGGVFNQPGLVEYIKGKGGLNLRPWPKATQPDTATPTKGFEVAFGTALQALGHSAQPVSLLPANYRTAWQKRLRQERLEFASFVLVGICALLLALGTWQKLTLIRHKTALREKVKAGQQDVYANDSLTGDLVTEYESLRPLFAAQQTTLDVLNTLSLLQQSRSNRSLWYVLVADQQTYFSPSPPLPGTNNLQTNLVATMTERLTRLLGSSPFPFSLSNSSAAKPGLIAELCVPEGAEASRVALSQIVKELKQQKLFSKVDLLSDDLRRNLADPKVTVPERDFVLSLDFAETELLQPLRKKAARVSSKATPRPASSGTDDGG
jgi:Tfp pilus assembly PilM family ATPase